MYIYVTIYLKLPFLPVCTCVARDKVVGLGVDICDQILENLP